MYIKRSGAAVEEALGSGRSSASASRAARMSPPCQLPHVSTARSVEAGALASRAVTRLTRTCVCRVCSYVCEVQCRLVVLVLA